MMVVIFLAPEDFLYSGPGNKVIYMGNNMQFSVMCTYIDVI